MSDLHDSFSDEKLGSEAVPGELLHGDYKSLDVGLALVAGHADEPELTPQESKRLRRKIDWHLLPMLCLIYTGALSLFARKPQRRALNTGK